jgi:ribosome maturation factor RimP
MGTDVSLRGDEAALYELLEPGARALGFELVTLELAGKGHGTVLRVYIDGPDGVTVDDCADVSHQLSGILDLEDPIPGHYTLEVSSPGLDRPLAKREHFLRVIGETVNVRLRSPLNGRRRFVGALRAVEADAVVVEVDGQEHRLALDEIERAKLVPGY